VVEQDPEMRDRIGGWLENEGHEVVACPGPSHPDYVCMAGRGVACPLAEAADAVVLDLWLASDRVLMGTPSTQVLSYYLSTGKPVVALSARHDHSRLFKLFVGDPLLVLEWPPDRSDLCETVRAVLLHGPFDA
jgi:DNA-binding response OmpR family regulator